MQRFCGYRTKESQTQSIETLLLRAKENIRQAAQEEYHRLLSDELAELIDDVAMSLRPRPDRPILIAATEQLNKQIMDAENFNSGTEYDLRAGVQIIPDSDGYIYLIFTAANPLLEQAFAANECIEDYTVGISPAGQRDNGPNEQAQKWEALNKRYNGASPLMSASLTCQMELDTSMLRIDNRATRATTRARRHLTTLLLNRYACGQEIRNDRLMLFLDKALARLLQEGDDGELARITDDLIRILPDYDLEFIQRDPQAAVDGSAKKETGAS